MRLLLLAVLVVGCTEKKADPSVIGRALVDSEAPAFIYDSNREVWLWFDGGVATMEDVQAIKRERYRLATSEFVSEQLAAISDSGTAYYFDSTSGFSEAGAMLVAWQVRNASMLAAVHSDGGFTITQAGLDYGIHGPDGGRLTCR